MKPHLPPVRAERRLAAILSADVAGYSRLMADDEDATVSALRAARELVATLVAEHRGRLADFTGDNFLAEFGAARDAVECALAIQRAAEARNEALPEARRMRLRIGVHLGDVRHEDDRVFGDGVNIAARLQPLAEPGGLCISAMVAEVVRGKIELAVEDLGEQTLKNIPGPVRAYRVRVEGVSAGLGSAPALASGPAASGRRTRSLWAAVGVPSAALLLILGAVWQVVVHLRVRPSAGEARLPTLPSGGDLPRLAILPFANLGSVPANEAFVDGVHDTLITQVSKVPGLTVISRSSVLQFEGRTPTIAEVAAALQVGAVLEGSVQRDGQRLRIQAQLIDAANDSHLWAETYDRDARDLFAVQTEIAQAVAGQLRIRLTRGDSERLAASLTRNAQAYEHYALGRSLMSAPADGQEPYERAISEFVTAISLDPDFAAAHAQLSIARTWLVFTHPERREEVLPLAKASVERALEIDPTLPEAHVAKAVYWYRGEPDLPAAVVEFETALAGVPNDSLAHLNLGYLLGYLGRFDEAVAAFERASEIDPRGKGFASLIHLLAFLGRREEARDAIARAQQAQPDNPEFALRAGSLAFDSNCDMRTWQATLEAVPERWANHPQVLQEGWFFALTSGDYRAAIERAERLARADPEEDYNGLLGWTYTLAGRQADAAARYRLAMQRMLRNLEHASPSDVRAMDMAYLARAFAHLGDRAGAIQYARQAIAALPPSGAARQRPGVLLVSAAALAYAGEIDAARAVYRQLLDLPFEIEPRGLWCDPQTAPLRADSAFRALMAEHGADLSIDPHRPETWPAARE